MSEHHSSVHLMVDPTDVSGLHIDARQHPDLPDTFDVDLDSLRCHIAISGPAESVLAVVERMRAELVATLAAAGRSDLTSPAPAEPAAATTPASHPGRPARRAAAARQAPGPHTRTEALMHPSSNHSPLADRTASLLVAALEHTWQTIRTHHPELPPAVLVVASGGEGRRLNLGHFAPHRWQVHGADRHEVLVGGEGLRRNAVDVLGTLLHEAAHGLAYARQVQDTSREGRYHNRRYATMARELGLDVLARDPIGWSITTVPEPTARAHAGQLQELTAALVLWRRLEQRAATAGRSRNLLACACPCGRRIRVAPRPWPTPPSSAAPATNPFSPRTLTRNSLLHKPAGP